MHASTNDEISPDEVAKLLIGKTIIEVKKTDASGKHLGISEIIFADGSSIMLGGNHDDAYIWMYQTPDGDAPLVIDPEFD
ncbi:hypothetical protein RYA05_01980 [Pseudomonas syringae pv. actinidiae]|nr:hypothetical protein [Pseudomonas syringae pv. actinidiae]